MLKLFIVFIFVATVLFKYENAEPIGWWDADDNKEGIHRPSTKTIPFPQCLKHGSKSNYLHSSHLDQLFDQEYRKIERDAKKDYYLNLKKHNNDKTDDYNDDDDFHQHGNHHISAAAAVKLTRKLMTKLACNLTGADIHDVESILHKFNMPEELCTIHKKVDCSEMSLYRTPSGLCNNLKHPYLGSAQTAYGRLVDANYQDRISEPRRKYKNGDPLPACRQISLALGSKPIFDRVFNNFFTAFGQYVAHDIALAVPVTDTYSTPITSCKCESKYETDKCTIIDVQPDDPYLRAQKCMAFPASAQAFKGEICSLGVKEQLNGNTHFIDLSALYGSSKTMAAVLRGHDGKLKSTRRYGAADLPPAQREGKSCLDGTEKHKCFAGGDSRLMVHTLITGIHTLFLRAHNKLAAILPAVEPSPKEFELYEWPKAILSGYFQKVAYHEWLPILIGNPYKDMEDLLDNILFTKYKENVKPVVYNEVATAAFRLHSLVRDLFTRCTPDGKRIDQLWLHDVLNKGKYAYDIENYGVDSFICGALYDYGFAFDRNFAHQIHHRLFESTGKHGQLWRNDLIAINICRGREHGLPSYTALREYCGAKEAHDFKDLGDRINYDAMKQLEDIYDGDIDAIDAFVGLNAEDPAPGALVGPTTACLIKKQFDVLKQGDRFFFSHLKQLTPECALALRVYPYRCFVCSTAAINSVPTNPFMPPSEDNPLKSCDKCHMDFDEYIGAACFDIFKTTDVEQRFEDAMDEFLVDFVVEAIKLAAGSLSRDQILEDLLAVFTYEGVDVKEPGNDPATGPIATKAFQTIDTGNFKNSHMFHQKHRGKHSIHKVLKKKCGKS